MDVGTFSLASLTSTKQEPYLIVFRQFPPKTSKSALLAFLVCSTVWPGGSTHVDENAVDAHIRDRTCECITNLDLLQLSSTWQKLSL